MYPEELTAGNWGPLNFTVQKAFGCDAAVLFAHLSQVAKRYAAKKSDGWFYIGLPKLIEVTGMTRKPIERSIDILAGAGLLMIDKGGQNNTRHYQLVQTMEELEAICAAHAAASKQTPARTPKTGPRAKQAANTANHTDQPREMVTPNAEPSGISEQLVPVAKPAKPKADNSEINAAAVRLVEHLNAVAGTAFRSTAKGNVDKFARVLKSKEGTEDEVRMVIEFKTMRWGNDPVMRAYLTPETLSRPSKFPGYLEEAYNAKSQQSRPTAVTDLVPVQNDTVAIMLPSGQQFGGYYEKKDQRKVDMVKAVLLAHPGIEEHLDPRLGMPAYLAGMRDIDLQNELKKAKSIYNTVNYKSPFHL